MYKPAPYKGGHQTRILIDRRAALGDLVMITPVLREMRKRYPEAWIQVVTEEPGILKNNPHVNSVVMPADMQKSDPWDVYVNLNDAYEKQVTSHYVDSYLHRAFGVSTDAIDRSPEMFPTDEEKQAVDEAVEEIGSDYIVVHMRRWAWENKNIDIEIWSALFTRLQEKYPGVKIVSVGAKSTTQCRMIQVAISILLVSCLWEKFNILSAAHVHLLDLIQDRFTLLEPQLHLLWR